MTTYLRFGVLVVGLGCVLAATAGGNAIAWDSPSSGDRIVLAQLQIRSISVPTQVRLPQTGAELMIPVELDDAAGLTSYRVQVHFPENLVSFARVENGNTTLNWPPPVINPRAADVIVVNAAAQAAIGGGSLINLVFEVRQGGGTADFALGDLTELNDGEIQADMMEKPSGEGEGESPAVRGEGEGEGDAAHKALPGDAGEGEGEGEHPGQTPGESAQEAISTPAPPDVFDPDDSPEQATWIGLNGPPQSHNFHRAGDADWAAFYAPAGNAVTIETHDLGPKCSTILELFSGDTMLSLAVNSGRAEGDPSALLTWKVEQNALFYVQVRHGTPTVFGQGTEYKLIVGRTTGACTKSAAITGTVTDSATHVAIASAHVVVGELGQRLSWPTLPAGGYTIPGLDQGSYTVQAKAPGYKDGLVQRVNLSCGGTGTANLTLVSTAPPPQPKAEEAGKNETPVIAKGEGEGEGEGKSESKDKDEPRAKNEAIVPPPPPPAPNSPLNKTTVALVIGVVAAGILLWVGRRFL